jgi:hypothetical protein
LDRVVANIGSNNPRREVDKVVAGRTICFVHSRQILEGWYFCVLVTATPNWAKA